MLNLVLFCIICFHNSRIFPGGARPNPVTDMTAVPAGAAGFVDNGSAVNLSLFVVADVDVLESKCAVHAAPKAS